MNHPWIPGSKMKTQRRKTLRPSPYQLKKEKQNANLQKNKSLKGCGEESYSKNEKRHPGPNVTLPSRDSVGPDDSAVFRVPTALVTVYHEWYNK